MSSTRRALHFVLKIGNLKRNIEFFRDKLGMTVLRHEVFDEGCEAACNGPYSGKWSKTMIGYGSENNHFVLELTYNYSIGSYTRGNDLQYIKIALGRDLFEKIEQASEGVKQDNKIIPISSPDGYEFILCQQDDTNLKQDVSEVCLSCENLDRSIGFWVDLLKMSQKDDLKEKNEALLFYNKDQCKLRLRQIDDVVDHKSAYGRIAFSCSSDELKPIQKSVEDAKGKILTPYLSLDTPGKATVQVVILADPDGHEICFVGDEGFRELSQVDPVANELIETAIIEDKSVEWFHKKKMAKKDV